MLKYLYAGLLALALFFFGMFIDQRAKNDRLREELAAVHTSLVTSQAQAAFNERLATAVLAMARRENVITLQTKDYADAVAQAEGGSSEVPVDVTGRWAAGVDGMRLEAATAHTGSPADPD